MSHTKHPKLPAAEVNEEWKKVRDLMQQHVGTVTTAILVGLILVVGLWSWHARVGRNRQQAAQMLANARATVDFEAILQQHGRTPSAPVARLSLAKLYYDLGQYEQAHHQYQAFIGQWSEHELVLTAHMGLLFTKEARGDDPSLLEALAGFRVFAEQHAGHYLYPQARLGEARCQQLLGNLEQARDLYESFLAEYPDNPWSLLADERLSALERKLRRQES